MKFSVGRNDGKSFKDKDNNLHEVVWFHSYKAAVNFIDSLPDQAAVERGDYFLDAPEEWNGE